MENLAKMSDPAFLKFVYKFHQDMVKHGIELVYEGEVNQEIVKTFTDMTQRNLVESEVNVPIQKRVYHVMVECLQNIGKHSDNVESGEPETPGNGIFMVSEVNDGFYVITGNPIATARIPEIEETLNTINAMDKDEIKAYYKKKILESRISEKGGAGLGFIDIVKKTGNEIQYHFEKINDVTSFFIIKTYIN